MKKQLLFFFSVIPFVCFSQDYETFFEDKTLRLDYIFGGNANKQVVVLDELSELPIWAGRKSNLNESYLDGNGQVRVFDSMSGACIYKVTFSTLFQEWLTTPEAASVSRSFENVFLVPFPKNKVNIEVCFRNKEGKYDIKLDYIVDPKDILIRKKGYKKVTPHRLIHQAKDKVAPINIAILAEGFSGKEMSDFYRFAKVAVDQILNHDPFGKYADYFNFYVVESVSCESGVSVPREGIWKNTVLGSHFDTFYSDRYLTTGRVKAIHDILAGIPYEHIIILANTDVYGGGGIYNAYTLTTTGHKDFEPVVVHEFGHSFGGLADEYFYESDALDALYSLENEPWERNITTLINFNAKWLDLVPSVVPIPTALSDSVRYPVGVYEGGGYLSKGVYRGSVDCRMKTNSCKVFCRVCQDALEGLIRFYTK